MAVENKDIRLMLVDDEPSITKALHKLLRREGYQISEFNDPQKALASVSNEPLHVVISDMRMPEMDGAQFLKHIREKKPNARRILLTGFSDSEASMRAINEGGIHAYLQKPWSNDVIKETLRQQVAEYAKTIRVKVAASQAKNHAQRADFFKDKLKKSENLASLQQSERELRVVVNLFSSFLRQQNEDLATLQDKAIALSGLICRQLQLQELRSAFVRYSCVFFPLNLFSGRQGGAADPYLLETLPLRFSGHVALERVANLLQLSLERPTRDGPLGMNIEEVPIDAQIVAIAIWTAQHLKNKTQFNVIEGYLQEQKNILFTEKMVEVTTELLPHLPDQQQSEDANWLNLAAGQELAEDVRDGETRLLLARGTVLTEGLIDVLRQYEWRSEEKPVIKVVVAQDSLPLG